MGLSELEAIRAIRARCRRASRQAIDRNSSQQLLLARCGDTLSVLDRAASCWWACSGPSSPHAIEYLLGGSASAATTATELAMDGYYDESISMTRSIAERANLVSLFVFSV